MDEKAIRGVPWSLLSFGANRMITLLTTVVLARLLVPADFGVLTLGLLFVTVFTLLGEFGLGSAMVLRYDLDARSGGTVLTLMLAMSAVLAAILVGLAPLAAQLFDEPRLTGPLRALSAVVALFGLNWFYDIALQRDLEFRTRFLAQATQTVAYAIVAIVAAALGAGVWALVAGQVTGSVAWSLALISLVPQRVRPTFDRTVAKEMLASGSAFMAQGGLAFVKQNSDYVSVGRLLGSGSLGLYSLAYKLADLPHAAIADPIAKVTFPGFAQMRARGEDVRTPFLSALRLVALVAAPMGVLLSGAAEPFTEAVFGDRWLGMIGALTALGLWGAVRPVHATIGWLLNSVGLPGVLARVSGVTLTMLIPGLFVAASLGGIEAVGWTMLAEMTLAAVALGVLAARHVDLALRDQLQALRPVLVACPVVWVATRLMANLAASLPAGATLVLSLGGGVAVYAALLRLVEPGLLGWTVHGARRVMTRSPVAEPPAPSVVAGAP